MGFGLEFLLIHITLKYYPFFRYYNLNSPCKVIKQKAKFRASNLTKYLMYRNFGTIFLFVLLGIVLVWVPLLISKLVAPKRRPRINSQRMNVEKNLKDLHGFNSIYGFMLLPLFSSFLMWKWFFSFPGLLCLKNLGYWLS